MLRLHPRAAAATCAPITSACHRRHLCSDYIRVPPPPPPGMNSAGVALGNEAVFTKPLAEAQVSYGL